MRWLLPEHIEDILPEGDEVVVTITGEIRDTAYFIATDTIARSSVWCALSSA